MALIEQTDLLRRKVNSTLKKICPGKIIWYSMNVDQEGVEIDCHIDTFFLI